MGLKKLPNGDYDWSVTKASMIAGDLARDDDFLSHLLIESLGNEAPLTVHKMDSGRRLPRHDPFQILAIVQQLVVPQRGTSSPLSRVREAVTALLRLDSVRRYIRDKIHVQTQLNAFATHASRYLELYLPTGSIEIAPTDRYTWKTGKSELCIIATVPLKVGTVITDLKGSLAELSNEEDEELKRTDRRTTDGGIRRDFSVIYSKQRNVSHLFLGPARFVNHDCEHNCELFRDGRYITFKVVRPIAIGQEVTAHYGEDYFGKRNRRCLCATCERRGMGRYAFEIGMDPDDVTTSESEGESDEDTAPKPAQVVPSGSGSQTPMRSGTNSTKPAPTHVAAGVQQLITPPLSEEEISVSGSTASRAASATPHQRPGRLTRSSLAKPGGVLTPTRSESTTAVDPKGSKPQNATAELTEEPQGRGYGLRKRLRVSVPVPTQATPTSPKNKSHKRTKPSKSCSDCRRVIPLDSDYRRCDRCRRHIMIYQAEWPSRVRTGPPVMLAEDMRQPRAVLQDLSRHLPGRSDSKDRPLKRQKLSHATSSTNLRDARSQRRDARAKTKTRVGKTSKAAMPNKKTDVVDVSDSEDDSSSRPESICDGSGVARDKASRVRTGVSRRQSAPGDLFERSLLSLFEPSPSKNPSFNYRPGPAFFARNRFVPKRNSDHSDLDDGPQAVALPAVASEVVDLTFESDSDDDPPVSPNEPPEEFSFVAPPDQSDDEDELCSRAGWGASLRPKLGPSFFARQRYNAITPPTSTSSSTPPPDDDDDDVVEVDGPTPSKPPAILSSHLTPAVSRIRLSPKVTYKSSPKTKTTAMSPLKGSRTAQQPQIKGGQDAQAIHTDGMVVDLTSDQQEITDHDVSAPPISIVTGIQNAVWRKYGRQDVDEVAPELDCMEFTIGRCDSVFDEEEDRTLREWTPAQEEVTPGVYQLYALRQADFGAAASRLHGAFGSDNRLHIKRRRSRISDGGLGDW